MKLLHLTFSCLLIVANKARVFESCELYYKLRNLGLDDYHGYYAKHFVCLALHPAAYNTKYYVNEYGNPHYGLFQLSGLEWCYNGRHKSPNKCNVTCDRFLDDDISDDAQCVKKVINEHGINDWRYYKKNCNFQLLNVINLKCTYWFEQQPWYMQLMKSKLAKNPMVVHLHFR